MRAIALTLLRLCRFGKVEQNCSSPSGFAKILGVMCALGREAHGYNEIDINVD